MMRTVRNYSHEAILVMMSIMKIKISARRGREEQRVCCVLCGVWLHVKKSHDNDQKIFLECECCDCPLIFETEEESKV